MAAESSVANNGALISDKFRLPQGFFEQLPKLLEEAESIFQTLPTMGLIFSGPAYQIARNFWYILLTRQDESLEVLTPLIVKFLTWRKIARNWTDNAFFHYEEQAMKSIYSLLHFTLPESLLHIVFKNNINAYTDDALFINCGMLLTKVLKGEQVSEADVGKLIDGKNALQIFVYTNLASLFDMSTKNVLEKEAAVGLTGDNGKYYAPCYEKAKIFDCLNSAVYDSDTFSLFVKLFGKKIFTLSDHDWASILNKVLLYDAEGTISEKAKKILTSVLLTEGINEFFAENFSHIFITLGRAKQCPFVACCVELNSTCVPKTFALLPFLPEELQHRWFDSCSGEDIDFFFSHPHAALLPIPTSQLVVNAFIYSLDKFSAILAPLKGVLSGKVSSIFWIISYVYHTARKYHLSLPEGAEIKLAKFEAILSQSSISQLADLLSQEMPLRDSNSLHEAFRALLVHSTHPDLKMNLALASLICNNLHTKENRSMSDITEHNIKTALTDPQYQHYLMTQSKNIFSRFEQLSSQLNPHVLTPIRSVVRSMEDTTPLCFSHPSSSHTMPIQQDSSLPEIVKTWIQYFDHHHLVLTLSEEQLKIYRDVASISGETGYNVDAIDTYVRFNQQGLALWSECAEKKPDATLIEIAMEVFNEYLHNPFRKEGWFHSAASEILLKSVHQYLQKTHRECRSDHKELLASELLMGILTILRSPMSFNSWQNIPNGRAAGILRVIVGKLVTAANLEPAPSLDVAAPPVTNAPNPTSSSS
jgi:hypothetical protein